MKVLDSLTLQYFYKENFDFIQGSVVQKIQLPSRYEIILNIRNINKSQNKKLYININPKYPHVCFINENSANLRDIKIPKNPPMFCMQLRKYLGGSKIKNFRVVEYERILEIYFDYFDEIGSLTSICLAVELMGKHSNIILYNAQNKTIIGAMHNISADKSSVREIYGGIKYFYPPQKQKLDILKTSFSTFSEIAKDFDVKKISDNFYYFNQSLVEKLIDKNNDKLVLFNKMQELQSLKNIDFIISFWKEEENINLAIDNYFSKFIFDEILKTKKAELKKCLNKDLKKTQKALFVEPNENKKENYKLFGDLIMSYLYEIKEGQKQFKKDNFVIELDENKTPTQNAQKYYQMYKKAKTAFEIEQERYQKAKEKKEYFESIIFNIENASDFEILEEIKEELNSIGLISQKIDKKTQVKVEKIEFKGWEIYVGKNNKQNDFLISKIATGEDLWFHGQNYPSSHIILKIPNNKKEPNKEVLEFCAKLTKENSKARDGGKASVIMTKRKNLKKPPNTYLGYVTYKNEIEIVI